MGEHFIERLTWPEVDARIGAGVDAVLIPIGSTEQHGHHMPLDTDCFIARSLCARAADAAADEGVELLVAPRTGEKIVSALIPRIVQVCKDIARKE